MGIYNDATAYGATAIGLSNKSLSTSSFTAGFESKTGGPYATAIGNNLYAKSYGSFVIGQFNAVAGDSLEWKATDPEGAADFEELKVIMAENEKRRNTILGKALETHNSGNGTIMVIIALQ